MMVDKQQFFRDIIGAGAIIAGFCGTFLAFRIQREANYFRQPDVNSEEVGKDIYIGLTQFTSSFLLIILATAVAVICGFLIPLFGLTGRLGGLITPRFAASGLVAALVLLVGYFLDELLHYEIICKNWRKAASGWRREWPIVVIAILLAGMAFAIPF
jgi:hypothetical protein